MNWKTCGTGRGLIKVITGSLLVGTEEKNKNPQSEQSPWNETELGTSFVFLCGCLTRF
jgi:hypothetical protein